MQIISQVAAAGARDKPNLNSNNAAKPVSIQGQIMDFMLLLQLLAGNQESAGQDAGPGYAGWDMANLQPPLNIDVFSLDNSHMQKADARDNNISPENCILVDKSVTSYINPEMMLLFQMLPSMEAEQNDNGASRHDVNQILYQDSESVDMPKSLQMDAAVGENNWIFIDPATAMALENSLTGTFEADGKTLAAQIINEATGKLASDGLIKTEPVVGGALPQPVNVTGQAAVINAVQLTPKGGPGKMVDGLPVFGVAAGTAEDNTAPALDPVQFNPKTETITLGALLPQGKVSSLAQNVHGLDTNALPIKTKNDFILTGASLQQSNTAVAPVTDTADSGAKHAGQHFMQQNPGDQTSAALTEAFSATPSTQGVMQQLRVHDSSFLSGLADIIKGQVSRDSAGRAHVKLQLQPENLGQVIIKLVFKDGNISTQFEATTEHAKQIIENSLPQLRETLANFQLNLQNASVTVGGDSGGRWGGEWNRGGNHSNRRSQFKDENEEVQSDADRQGQLNYYA
ncbi:flagellar hook-length control protein FliK [Desulfotruncus alcoholivorax]|uniref:flagellar hook-length control protein FliK n=1 Tax=Desulfotruncus alcoholivorax TaxID=265477 RepID=UPI0003FAD6EA|nr:flagellar hook-length control protein FliK [Desulfotruncus alcoholivorax]